MSVINLPSDLLEICPEVCGKSSLILPNSPIRLPRLLGLMLTTEAHRSRGAMVS